MDKSCDILFEYVRSILYDRKIRQLNMDIIDGDHRNLAEGLRYLANCVEELNEYSSSLSTGNLSINFPSEYNELCMNLKNLHANLNHLTWQAIRVAQGDYSQKVSYLGDFSIAFNKMTGQLSEREMLLNREANNARTRSDLLQSYNSLLVSLTRNRREWIFVVDEKDGRILYCNKAKVSNEQPAKFMESYDVCKACPHRLDVRDEILSHYFKAREETWEVKSHTGENWYQAHAYEIEWEGRKADVYIIEDITKPKKEEEYLNLLVYRDQLTGLYNRRYTEEKLAGLIEKGQNFTFVFADIDGLKYVNDNLGHKEGDDYINYIAAALVSECRDNDTVSRLGGDEFGIILENCAEQIAGKKMDGVYCRMQNEKNEKNYYRGFSYGCIEISRGDNITPEKVIERADAGMYSCKSEHQKHYDNGR